MKFGSSVRSRRHFGRGERISQGAALSLPESELDENGASTDIWLERPSAPHQLCAAAPKTNSG